jgi:hypothetical protein
VNGANPTGPTPPNPPREDPPLPAPVPAGGPPPTTTSPPDSSGNDTSDKDAPPSGAEDEAATPVEVPGDPVPPLPIPPTEEPADTQAATQLEGIEEGPEETADPGADLPGFMPAHVNHLLDAVYGDWPHHNDGSHLDGRVASNSTWQQLAADCRLANNPLFCPKRKSESTIRHHACSQIPGGESPNLELGAPHRVCCSHPADNTRGKASQGHPEAHDAPDGPVGPGQILFALVDDTETEVQSGHGTHPVLDEDTLARAFNARVLSGRLRSAVHTLTQRG